MTDTTGERLHTTVNRGWMTKMTLICVFMVGFGLWGLYDALVAYPARGEQAASFFQYQHLSLLESRRDGSLLTRSSVPNPTEEFARLQTALDDQRLTEEERPKYQWLEQLKLISRLKPEYTTVSDPTSRLSELRATWSAAGKKEAANELSWYDIPAQWLIMAVGLGVGLYMIGLILKVRGTRYSWEPAAQRLFLPSGATLTPGDIEVFDKRRWDKFLIYLKIRPSHAALGGKEIMLDLLRHAPLEEWVLQMERTAFPEQSADPPATSAPPEPGAASGSNASAATDRAS
jgi:hypothetical protein